MPKVLSSANFWVGAGEIAGGVLLDVAAGGLNPLGTMILMQGIATEAGSIAKALGSNAGMGVTTRSAAAYRQIIRGEQRVGGTIVYCSTTGNSKRQYNLAIAFATHLIDSYVNLYLDGRPVIWQPGSSGNIACGAVAVPAIITPTIASGVITGLTLVNGEGDYWAGYSSGLGATTVIPARVRILGDGHGATATAHIQGGSVINVALVNGGTGYTHATVIVDGAFIFGGNADPGTYDGPNGQHYTFGSEVYCHPYFGDQNATTGYCTDLYANDPTWAPTTDGTPYLGGCAWIYLKLESDSATFPQFPEIRATIKGKSDIYDPRTGLTGYTSNWALQVADALTDPLWGVGDNTVNQAQLIAAANVCDELMQCQAPLLVGGLVEYGSLYEARYALHWHYETSMSPGDVLHTMMDAAAGRLSRIGGEWYIWPAYWQGPSFSFDENALLDAPQWESYRDPAELNNRIIGTYIAANYPYNVAGDLYDSNGYWQGEVQNKFPYAFQPTNYPMYACDERHGYGTGVDVFLTEDGGIPLPLELDQSCILSIAQAQRVAKIVLLRNRQQGSGKFTMSLAAWQMQPTDVMQFTFPAFGWLNKNLEIAGDPAVTFKVGKLAGQDVPSVFVEICAQETDPSVYEWELEEELNAYDIPVFAGLGEPYIVPPPTGVSLEDDATTALVGSDGNLIPRALVTWIPPVDTGVNNGGHIEVQYQYEYPSTATDMVGVPVTTAGGTSTTDWIDAGKFSGQATYCFIDGVPQATQINVQVRAVRANGAASIWVGASHAPLGRIPVHVSKPWNIQPAATNFTVPGYFADLAGLGEADTGMTIATSGNALTVGVNLAFKCNTGSGGAVTGIGTAFPGGTSGSATPPTVTISISGDGTSASASVTFTYVTGSGSSTVWAVSLSITGGSGYTHATATVTVAANGCSGFTGGTTSYPCTITGMSAVSGEPVQVQILMDGAQILGPVMLATDANGNAVFSGQQLIAPAPSAGNHVFQVQAMTTSSSTVLSTSRSLQVVELA